MDARWKQTRQIWPRYRNTTQCKSMYIYRYECIHACITACIPRQKSAESRRRHRLEHEIRDPRRAAVEHDALRRHGIPVSLLEEFEEGLSDHQSKGLARADAVHLAPGHRIVLGHLGEADGFLVLDEVPHDELVRGRAPLLGVALSQREDRHLPGAALVLVHLRIACGPVLRTLLACLLLATRLVQALSLLRAEAGAGGSCAPGREADDRGEVADVLPEEFELLVRRDLSRRVGVRGARGVEKADGRGHVGGHRDAARESETVHDGGRGQGQAAGLRGRARLGGKLCAIFLLHERLQSLDFLRVLFLEVTQEYVEWLGQEFSDRADDCSHGLEAHERLGIRPGDVAVEGHLVEELELQGLQISGNLQLALSQPRFKELGDHARDQSLRGFLLQPLLASAESVVDHRSHHGVLRRGDADGEADRPRAHVRPGDRGQHEKTQLPPAPPLTRPLLRGVLLANVPDVLPVHVAGGARAGEVHLLAAAGQAAFATPSIDVGVGAVLVEQRDREQVRAVSESDTVDTNLGIQYGREQPIVQASVAALLAHGVQEVQAGDEAARTEVLGLIGAQAPQVLGRGLAGHLPEFRARGEEAHYGRELWLGGLLRGHLQKRRLIG
mmetsp:Transcript_112265/g.356698  ORF Transcript_112265/g.356698 Transcript_112265/m.356698 type:complete len:613 (-) Transcript_112265:185-2023(-)